MEQNLENWGNQRSPLSIYEVYEEERQERLEHLKQERLQLEAEIFWNGEKREAWEMDSFDEEYELSRPTPRKAKRPRWYRRCRRHSGYTSTIMVGLDILEKEEDRKIPNPDEWFPLTLDGQRVFGAVCIHGLIFGLMNIAGRSSSIFNNDDWCA